MEIMSIMGLMAFFIMCMVLQQTNPATENVCGNTPVFATKDYPASLFRHVIL
jgi:hypothetical protein